MIHLHSKKTYYYLFFTDINGMWRIASANEHPQQQHTTINSNSNTQEGMKNNIDIEIFNFKKPDNLVTTKVAELNDRLAMM